MKFSLIKSFEKNLQQLIKLKIVQSQRNHMFQHNNSLQKKN